MLKERYAVDSVESIKDLDAERVRLKRKSGWGGICIFRYMFLKKTTRPRHVVECLILS